MCGKVQGVARKKADSYLKHGFSYLLVNKNGLKSLYACAVHFKE